MWLAFWAGTAHCQLVSSFSSTNTLCGGTAFHPFIAHSVLIAGIVPTLVQDLALGLAELHEVKITLVMDLPKQLLILASPYVEGIGGVFFCKTDDPL